MTNPITKCFKCCNVGVPATEKEPHGNWRASGASRRSQPSSGRNGALSHRRRLGHGVPKHQNFRDDDDDWELFKWKAEPPAPSHTVGPHGDIKTATQQFGFQLFTACLESYVEALSQRRPRACNGGKALPAGCTRADLSDRKSGAREGDCTGNTGQARRTAE